MVGGFKTQQSFSLFECVLKHLPHTTPSKKGLKEETKNESLIEKKRRKNKTTPALFFPSCFLSELSFFNSLFTKIPSLHNTTGVGSLLTPSSFQTAKVSHSFNSPKWFKCFHSAQNHFISPTPFTEEQVTQNYFEPPRTFYTPQRTKFRERNQMNVSFSLYTFSPHPNASLLRNTNNIN